MIAKKKEAVETQPEPKLQPTKHKIIAVSSYYAKASELIEAGLKGIKRDVALELLCDEYEGRIVQQADDKKSGEIKFVVKP